MGNNGSRWKLTLEQDQEPKSEAMLRSFSLVLRKSLRLIPTFTSRRRLWSSRPRELNNRINSLKLPLNLIPSLSNLYMTPRNKLSQKGKEIHVMNPFWKEETKSRESPWYQTPLLKIFKKISNLNRQFNQTTSNKSKLILLKRQLKIVPAYW